MSVKVRGKRVSITQLQKTAAQAIPALLWFAVGAASFFAAQAPFFGTLHPLALALAASVLAPYAFSACAGAMLGYLLGVPLGASVAYIAGIIAIAIARFVATRGSQRFSPYAPAAVGALSYAVTAVGVALLTSAGIEAVLYAVADALLMLGLAYLFYMAISQRGQALTMVDAEGAAALLVSLMAALICLGPYHIFTLPLIIFVGACVALFASICLRTYGGAAVGMAVCIALVVADTGNLYAGFGIAVGSLAASFCARENRAFAAVVFAGAGLSGVLAAPSVSDALRYGGLLCLVAVIICALPQKAFAKLPGVSSAPANRAALTTLSGRLDAISGALASVGVTLDAVCAQLPKKGESYADVCDIVTERVCRNCPRCAECWTSGASVAYDALNDVQDRLVRAGGISAKDFPRALRESCVQGEKLAACLTSTHAAYLLRRSAGAQGSNMRGALTEQYGALAAALAQLAGQVYREDVPDQRKKNKIEKLFASLGVPPYEVMVSLDASGRIIATATVPAMALTAQEAHALTQEVSALCNCAFAPVQLRQAASCTQLLFREKPMFKPVYGIASLAAQGKVSADICRTFYDANGYSHAMLCDGMGTGKEAAVDGNLAAKLTEQLLCVGFGAGEAARLVNVALSLKGSGECAAALDILTLNCYTGRGQLFKAGGVASLLLRQGTVTVIDADTLPIGILTGVTGRTNSLRMQPGDMFVMMSDGALERGIDWITTSLALTKNVPPQILAESIARAAKKRATHPDDITVLCLQLQKA